MNSKNEGLFSRLFGKKQNCCCSFEVEQISNEETADNQDSPQNSNSQTPKDNNQGSCCGK